MARGASTCFRVQFPQGDGRERVRAARCSRRRRAWSCVLRQRGVAGQGRARRRGRSRGDRRRGDVEPSARDARARQPRPSDDRPRRPPRPLPSEPARHGSRSRRQRAERPPSFASAARRRADVRRAARGLARAGDDAAPSRRGGAGDEVRHRARRSALARAGPGEEPRASSSSRSTSSSPARAAQRLPRRHARPLRARGSGRPSCKQAADGARASSEEIDQARPRPGAAEARGAAGASRSSKALEPKAEAVADQRGGASGGARAARGPAAARAHPRRLRALRRGGRGDEQARRLPRGGLAQARGAAGGDHPELVGGGQVAR